MAVMGRARLAFLLSLGALDVASAPNAAVVRASSIGQTRNTRGEGNRRARKPGPKHRMCRRVGQPLCGSPKCPALKRPYPPGQHGSRPRRRVSEYGRQRLEKQKLKFLYGVQERQL